MKYLVHNIYGSASSARISSASVELFVFSFDFWHAEYRPASQGHDRPSVPVHIIMHRVGGVHPPLYDIQVIRTQYQGHPDGVFYIFQ